MNELQPVTRRYYAGFWLRAAAHVIDSVISSVYQAILIFSSVFAARSLAEVAAQMGPVASNIVGALTSLAFLIAIFGAPIIYFAAFESSDLQATPGKLILGLQVTDMQGRRLSFWHSALRQICKVVSMISFYVGYLMAGFTERRQALHDMMTGCLVVRKGEVPQPLMIPTQR